MNTNTFDYHMISANQGRLFRKSMESLACAAAALLGVMFLGIGFTPYADVYYPMSMVAPAAYWGLLIFTLAIARAGVLVVNGFWPHSHVVRRWLSVLFLFLIWIPLGTCYWWSFLQTVGSDEPRAYPSVAFSIFTVGAEFVIFYAHSSFVHINHRGLNG
jgi:hypothetical protein